MDQIASASELQPTHGRRSSFVRFVLRAFLVLTLLIVCVSLGAFFWRRETARKQAELGERIKQGGGWVWYEDSLEILSDGSRFWKPDYPAAPTGAAAALGRDFFQPLRCLKTPRSRPGTPNELDPELLREALAWPTWWELQLCSDVLRQPELERIGRQEKLDTLDCVLVMLPEQDLRPLTPLPSLARLRFIDVSLELCDLGALEGLPNLQQIRFIRCDISNGQLAQIPQLERLTNFDAEDVRANNADCRWLRSFPNLETLKLSSVPVTDADLVHLAAMPNLKEVSLNRTRIVGRLPEGIRLPSSIESLNLQGSPVERCEWISDLPNLKWFYAGNTLLDRVALGAVQWPSSLESVQLLDVEVDDVVLANLAKLPSLDLLVLSDDCVEPWHVEQFRARCPECNVQVAPKDWMEGTVIRPQRVPPEGPPQAENED